MLVAWFTVVIGEKDALNTSGVNALLSGLELIGRGSVGICTGIAKGFCRIGSSGLLVSGAVVEAGIGRAAGGFGELRGWLEAVELLAGNGLPGTAAANACLGTIGAVRGVEAMAPIAAPCRAACLPLAISLRLVK